MGSKGRRAVASASLPMKVRIVVGSQCYKEKGQVEYDLAFFAQMEPQTVTWAPALFRVAGGTRACGHCFLPLRTSSQSQSSDQQGHNHHHFYKFQFISPPFAASCSACLGKGSHRSNVFLRRFGCIAPRDFTSRSRLDYHRTVIVSYYSSMTTGMSSSTRSNKSMMSALRIRTQP